MALHTLEICAGVGMLGEGLRAGLAHLGVAHRTVCYLEREAYAASVLAARCEEGSLDAAPVWSDLLTFDAAAWHGAVDCIAAGFPCQDLSLAGRRAGLDGQRSGLFFDILDIADACGARLLFLENVAGIASATASVVDEAEGALDERAAARVLGELADRGWDAEWLTLSASDVGASHGRARWFCFAWRKLGDPDKQLTGREVSVCDGGQRRNGHQQSSDELGHADQLRQQQPHNAEAPSHGVTHGLVLAGQAASWPTPICQDAKQSGHAPSGPGLAEKLSFTAANWTTPATRDYRTPNSQTFEARGGGYEGRAIEQLCRAPLFAPGPADGRWASIISHHPHLAPALEPGFRSVVNGLAFDMDDCRAARLKCVGNGVVPLCAAAAFVVLFQRSGITA